MKLRMLFHVEEFEGKPLGSGDKHQQTVSLKALSFHRCPNIRKAGTDLYQQMEHKGLGVFN